MSENETANYIKLEPNWDGLRRWAEHGLRGPCTARERKAFREIIAQCDAAQQETAQCPHCLQVFTAPRGHDPLKRHIDYCEGNEGQ